MVRILAMYQVTYFALHILSYMYIKFQCVIEENKILHITLICSFFNST
jgi:hypothetical protein